MRRLFTILSHFGSTLLLSIYIDALYLPSPYSLLLMFVQMMGNLTNLGWVKRGAKSPFIHVKWPSIKSFKWILPSRYMNPPFSSPCSIHGICEPNVHTQLWSRYLVFSIYLIHLIFPHTLDVWYGKCKFNRFMTLVMNP